MKTSEIHFEEPVTVTTDFALIGKSCGQRKIFELHKVDKGRIGAQIPFSKKTAERIFSIFDSERYVPKSFKGFIPKNVVIAKDGPTDGMHLIWTVKEAPRTLYFSNSSGIKTGVYAVPDLIFRYKANVLQVLATKTVKVDGNTALFHAPFFNVYTTGNICMGNVNVHRSERFESFDGVMEFLENAFFNSVFTHSNNPLIDAQLIQRTQGQKTYTNDLYPIYNSRTDGQTILNDLI